MSTLSLLLLLPCFLCSSLPLLFALPSLCSHVVCSCVLSVCVCSAAESARAAFDQIDSRVNRLQKKMDDLQKTLDRDYGAEAQFLHMDGACFELPIKQYTYEVCPYGKAAQKEGGSSTSLGTWEGMERNSDGSYVLKFHNGQSCWQGPQRSLTVNLRCGPADKPLAVEEPSKCVYEMDMETPAVCNMQHAQALKLNLEGAMEDEEEEEQ